MAEENIDKKSINSTTENTNKNSYDNQSGYSYNRENGEAIVDPRAIKSCKDEQNRDIIENTRLGSYDKYGNYIIIPEIVDELLSIPKLIYNSRTEDRDKVYDLKSEIPIFNEIYFKLKISKVEAVLYLVETVQREAGEYVEVFEEPLDALSLFEEHIPESIIFRTYNIFKDEDDYGRQFEEFFNFENILLRKVYLTLLSDKLQDKTKTEEKEYFKTMLNILQNGGEYGKKVINEFMKRIKDRKEIFETQDENEYNRATSEILLSAMEMVTTEKDLQDENNKKIYFEVLNVRSKNIEKHIKNAQKEIDENFIRETVNNATRAHLEKNEEKQQEVKLKFEDKLSKKAPSKQAKQKKTIEKPLMKQLTAQKQKEQIASAVVMKEILGDETKTKEQKIEALVEKKQEIKKQQTPVKKVTPSKAQKKTASKSPAKKSAKPTKSVSKPASKSASKPASKSASKSASPKPKVKNTSTAVKKPKSPNNGKNKKDSKKPDKSKDKDKKKKYTFSPSGAVKVDSQNNGPNLLSGVLGVPSKNPTHTKQQVQSTPAQKINVIKETVKTNIKQEPKETPVKPKEKEKLQTVEEKGKTNTDITIKSKVKFMNVTQYENKEETSQKETKKPDQDKNTNNDLVSLMGQRSFVQEPEKENSDSSNLNKTAEKKQKSDNERQENMGISDKEKEREL